MRVSRLVVNLKIDRREAVWFLWSSSLRLFNDKELPSPKSRMNHVPLNMNDRISLARTIREGITTSTSCPRQMDMNTRCYSCGACVEENRMYEASFKMIIDDHLHRADKQSALKVNPAHNVTDPK